MATRLQLHTNMEGIAEIIGAVEGMADRMDEDYLSGLILEAHRLASDEFDMVATATAAASGRLSHVFEYGVPGITRGPTRHSDPTSPEARLWMHSIIGGQGVFDINYIFRPAKTPNPQPTTASTGVESKYLRKLSRRKYIFFQRALVMETGQEVTIKSKSGRRLFVPFYGRESDNPNNTRGYAMVPGPIRVQPGRESIGNFTSFWNAWWQSEGEEIVRLSIEGNVRRDAEEIIRTGEIEAGKQRMEPIHLVNISQTANGARAKAIKKTTRKTASRKAKKRTS